MRRQSPPSKKVCSNQKRQSSEYTPSNKLGHFSRAKRRQIAVFAEEAKGGILDEMQ